MCIFRCSGFQSPRTLKQDPPHHSLSLPQARAVQTTPLRSACAGCGDGFLHASRFFSFRRIWPLSPGHLQAACLASRGQTQPAVFFGNGLAALPGQFLVTPLVSDVPPWFPTCPRRCRLPFFSHRRRTFLSTCFRSTHIHPTILLFLQNPVLPSLLDISSVLSCIAGCFCIF